MRILQVSCSYFPDKIGGTETYVHYLSKGLTARGHEISVCYVQDLPVQGAAPFNIRSYTYDGIPVHVLEKNTFGSQTQDIYFQAGSKIRSCFSRLLEQLKPEIVHFHHLSSTDIIDAAEAARERGVTVMLTYHTPMMTCCQGQMLYRGFVPCEGAVEFRKCLECVQASYGVLWPLAWAWARLPLFFARYLGSLVSRLKLKSPLATWLQLPWMEHERVQRIRYGLGLFDHFVAVSEWVRSLLLANGVPLGKITLCRQGVETIPEKKPHLRGEPLKAVFIGRTVRYKGLDVLLRAVTSLDASVAIEVDVYGAPQDPREKEYVRRLKKRSAREKRIVWKGALEPDKKFAVLAQADVVLIPSLWQETGPLVLLEAWAAGVPVIGSRRGAIKELMADGRGGLLFDPGDHRKLACLLSRVTAERSLLDDLKKTIPVPKTMDDVVVEMEALYRKVSSQKGGQA